jgi:methyl-accepting chemotaxis protein
MKKRQRRLQTKLQLPILITSILVFGFSIAFVALRTHQLAVSDAKTIVNTTAREYANLVTAALEQDINVSRTFAQTLLGYLEARNNEVIDLTLLTLSKSIEKYPEIYATWVSYELRALDPTWNLGHGRRRITYHRDGNSLTSKDEKLDLQGDNISGIYYFAKTNKHELVTNPYYFSYSGNEADQILETSICIPLLRGTEFLGLAGVDISLERFGQVIDAIKPFRGSEAMLLANNGQIVAFPNKKYVGKLYTDLNKTDNEKFQILENVKNGIAFNYETTLMNKPFYVTYVPILLGESKTPWSLQIAAPLDVILERSSQNIRLALIIGFIGLVILSLLIWYIAHNIILPIKDTTHMLKIIAEGNLSKVSRLQVHSGDEIETMSNSLNQLIDSLKQMASFAKDIGQGKLDSEYNLLSRNDEIGNALIDMQKSLQKASEEEKLRRIEDEKQNWVSRGIALFGDILRQDNVNIEELTFNIVSNLVKYVGVQQGCIYIVNEKDQYQSQSEVYFEMKAAVAFDRRKLLKDKVYTGEGLVGRCAHEKLTIYMIDVPRDYVHITSGLGEAEPGSILLVPLMLNQQVFGVLEMVSFKQIEQHKISFVEKIAESIAGTLSSAKINEKTKELLIESQKQREELASQEEEMRQNLEELQATQEDASRREAEMRSIWNVFSHIALIIEYDMEFKVLTVNDKCQEFFGDTSENIVGMPHQALGFVEDRDAVEHTSFIQRIKQGMVAQRRSNLMTRTTKKWLQETYSPLYDHDGNITRYVSVAIDITLLVELENRK